MKATIWRSYTGSRSPGLAPGIHSKPLYRSEKSLLGIRIEAFLAPT